MDRFIITKTKKNDEKLLIGREDVMIELKECIKKKEIVCVYGESGVGKTYMLEHILQKNFIEISEIILKSKQSSLDFIEKLKNTKCPIMIDNYNTNLPGSKEFLEMKNTCLIIVSLVPIVADDIKLIHLKNFNVNELVNLGRLKFPKKPLQNIVELAKKSRGNIRNFLISLNFSDCKDIFKTPKQFVYDLVCSDVKYPETPSLDSLNKIQEHGYSWGIIHENYLDSPDVKDSFEEISELMSISDVFDTIIYENNWDDLKYFNLFAIIMPAIKMKHSISTDNMRPGSAWTKYSNYKMRLSRFKSMRIPLESVYLHRMYLENGDISRFLNYKLKSIDVDTINHLCIETKLKAKNILKLKKQIKNAYEIHQ